MSISRYVRDAVALMGKQVRLGRAERGWSQRELSERAGIARATLQKIEAGDPGCAVGTVFEVAALVGVELFGGDGAEIAAHVRRVDDKLTLLPRRIHKKVGRVVLDDDF